MHVMPNPYLILDARYKRVRRDVNRPGFPGGSNL